jgi:hypothetical protein
VKRLGPELKMPRLKGGEMNVPPFLSDLYFDLRERRLLPLVVLILVAIVATPILLAGGSSEAELPPAPRPIVSGGKPASDLTVVKAEPGLRNYRKRLGHRHATNPFKQRFNGPRLAGGQLNEQTTTSTSSSSTTEAGSTFESETAVTSPSGSHTGGSSPSGGGEKGGNDELPHGLTLFTFAIDVQITRIEPRPDGSVAKTGPTLHREVLPPTPLPGQKAPVATYLGMGAKTELPLFLVSPEVTGVFGEAKCVAGTGSCQLLAVEPGFPEAIEYGPNHVRYKIKVLKVKPVVTGKS